MCQMLNIWHIYHTKYRNNALWDVPNFKNYTTWLQYHCKFATVRTNVVKNLLFYILFSLSSLFIFSFLFSLTLRFPLSSPCISSLSLRRWSFRDRHVSRTKLRRRFRLPPSISSVKHGNDKRLRFGLRSRRSLTRLNSPSTDHARSAMLDLTHAPAMLDLADITPRPPSILFPLLSVHLSLCLSLVVGFFFFFYCSLG